MESNCPNFKECKLANTVGFVGSEQHRLKYIDSWCKGGLQKWSNCTRFVVHKALNFCPDFVMPDTNITPDEVIDKFDMETE